VKLILWLISLAAIFFFFLSSIRYIESHSLYFPMKKVTATPALAGLAFDDVYFMTSDHKRLNGWFLANDKAKFTVIFSHGNAGNISHRLEKVMMLNSLELNIFIFDYRGYGNSQGVPSEAGFYEDIKAAYSYLIKERKIAKENIILYGESIGGAVAIDLAQKVKPRAIIVEDTFTSIKDMVKIAFPFMPRFVFLSRFNSLSKIKMVICAKLIIHSKDDEIVPFYLGEKLFNAAIPPKEFLALRGSHNSAFLESKNQYLSAIQSFINKL